MGTWHTVDGGSAWPQTSTSIHNVGISPVSKFDLAQIEETERVVRVARILSTAEQVFASHDKTLSWLRSTAESLNDRTPLSMLPTEARGHSVESMLWQIDEGIHA